MQKGTERFSQIVLFIWVGRTITQIILLTIVDSTKVMVLGASRDNQGYVKSLTRPHDEEFNIQYFTY